MAQILESIMLICFGASWPSAIIKTLRVKDPKGKSFVFLGLVVLGYVSGTIGKIVHRDFNWVFWIYLLDLAMVTTDLVLSAYYRYRKKSENL